VQKLDASVLDFEPQLALDGGDTGLDLVARMLMSSPPHLSNPGRVLLEIDDSHTVEDLQKITGPTFTIQLSNDIFGVPRFAVLSKVLPHS
jgi:release factor glutamine methyltransferase